MMKMKVVFLFLIVVITIVGCSSREDKEVERENAIAAKLEKFDPSQEHTSNN